jgi:single-strand DNA-binding protein
MLNQTVIVGRLVKDPELKETENGSKVTNITLAVPRSFKNSNGEYETDFISCVLWRGIAENTVEYCKKGDLLGVKGRVQSRSYESEDEKKHFVMEIIAEKVTFLSSKSKEEEK